MLLMEQALEVTMDPRIKVYREPRSPDAYVRSLLQLDVFDRRYAKDKYGTHCNLLVHDALVVCGVNEARAKANEMIASWSLPNSGWMRMVWQDAVTNALLGCPTVAGLIEQDHGHVCIILPANASRAMEILGMQAGANNFYGRQIVQGFGLRMRDVQYFGHP